MVASWYIVAVTGALILLTSSVVLVRSLFVKYKTFFVLMCALILLASMSGMAMVRIELAIFRVIASLPQPLTVKDAICYAKKDTSCPFY